VDHDPELADLTVFCTADSGPAYAWWRAGAWAGKTALMSWFAPNPPPGVRVVPFFVTARLGAQNDVTAYIDVALEQLAELRRRYTRVSDGRDPALACRERGERLVLLVDGLDEDRGVTTGPDAHSIASLLPSRPEAGMRVLVAGRLNPPLPGSLGRHDALYEEADSAVDFVQRSGRATDALLRTLVAVGRYERAEGFARALAEPARRASAEEVLVEALVEVGASTERSHRPASTPASPT
jgi:hypothetical protein